MKTVKISLNSIDKVKAFVNEISKFDCDFDLVSVRYVIDAKSIMGIFSLDLSKPIDLNIHADGSALDGVMDIIQKYTVEEFSSSPAIWGGTVHSSSFFIFILSQSPLWFLMPHPSAPGSSQKASPLNS